MKRRKFKISLVVLNAFTLLSCGIKTDVEPLPKPKYRVLRVGELVYIIPEDKNVIPEGFRKEGNFFVKKERGRFCFRVRHVEGKEETRCVREASSDKPEARVEVEGDHLKLSLEEEGKYRVYPYRDRLIPQPIEEVEGDLITLKRKYEPYKVAITKVENGIESAPIVVDVPALKPPTPTPPKGVKILKKAGKIYIYWWAEENMKYMVYKNGMPLTKEPTQATIVSDEIPAQETTYEVIAINEFGVRSKPARIIYKP